MRSIRINPHRLSKSALAAAVLVLKQGGVVAYPTETAYGLAADSSQTSALKKVLAIKGRESSKKLPYIAGTWSQVNRFVLLPPQLKALAKKFWPGPLTVIGKHFGGRGTVAVRIPQGVWASALASALRRPVTSTSANISGKPALYSGQRVYKEFRGQQMQPDIILDAGTIPRRRVSTIVALRRGKVTVVRQGIITVY